MTMTRIALIIAFAAMVSGCRQQPAAASSNALFVIAPYKHAGTWVFDDPAVGLRREPFVAGVPRMIDDMVKEIPDADKGFRLIFSAQEFPGYTRKLIWKRKERGGTASPKPDRRESGNKGWRG